MPRSAMIGLTPRADWLLPDPPSGSDVLGLRLRVRRRRRVHDHKLARLLTALTT